MPDIENVMEYGRDVLAGKIDVCRYTRLAVERHFKEYDNQNRGFYFDEEAALDSIRFFSFLKHSKGEWAGQQFELAPWQKFWTALLFGWKQADGYRRYRVAYIEVPRKNGKSTWLSGLGLLLFFADGEGGAEVYSAATKEAQAKIVWSEAKRMVQASPALSSRIGCHARNLHHLPSASSFEYLGRDSDTQDGLNIHAAIIDELHAHKDRGIWDVIETATGARRQPLVIAITTAGTNRHGVCYEQRDYLIKILEGVLEDDSMLGVIYGLDFDEKGILLDDWRKESSWKKANPNYGVSVYAHDIKRLCRKAQEIPGSQNNFLTKRLDVWCSQDEKWLDMDVWAAAGKAFDESKLHGRLCYGGLDLSTKLDLTSFELVFPPIPEDPMWYLLSWFWIPKDNIEGRVRRDKVPYDVWAERGFIKATPGNVIDYDIIENDIDELGKKFKIQEIGFDPWNASGTAGHLETKGFAMTEVRQGTGGMGEPSKEFEAKIIGGTLNHGNHPILTWCASNVTLRYDANDNYMPDKKNSRERIDGVVAAVMALGRAIVADEPVKSFWET